MNNHESLSNTSKSSQLSQWDTLKAVPRSETSMAKFYAKEARDIELDFAKQLERAEARGEDTLPQKEFEIWEDDYQKTWSKLEKELGDGYVPMDEEAAAKAPAIAYHSDAEFHKTIEAQAGHFYDERRKALQEAIAASDLPDQADDAGCFQRFQTAILTHLDFRYTDDLDAGSMSLEDYKAFESARIRAHNQVIKRLNDLNSLAEKYGTRRFTPRDFWTSEVQDQTPAMSKLMYYDHYIVQEYYTFAFSATVKRRERRANRNFY